MHDLQVTVYGNGQQILLWLTIFFWSQSSVSDTAQPARVQRPGTAAEELLNAVACGRFFLRMVMVGIRESPE